MYMYVSLVPKPFERGRPVCMVVFNRGGNALFPMKVANLEMVFKRKCKQNRGNANDCVKVELSISLIFLSVKIQSVSLSV